MPDDKNYLVLFQPSGRRGRFPAGMPVLDAARSLGVYIESVCGGRGICGRCQIEIAEGQFAKQGIVSRDDHLTEWNEVEERYRQLRALPSGRRLSCQARVAGDLVVDVPEDTAIAPQLVRKRAETRRIDPDPAIRLCTVTVDEPAMDRPRGALDRLLAALEKALGHPVRDFETALLDRLPTLLQEGHFEVTAAIYDDGREPMVVALWPGRARGAFGVAVDIGSTTIAGHLCDLTSGRVVASAGTSNPQIRFGEDLMSRVSYVMMNPDGRVALTEAVRGAIRALVDRICGQAGITAGDVLEAVFVANPVMHHLFLGLDPTPLGQAPFALAVSRSLHLRADDFHLGFHQGARIYVLPCIAGHVGADAAAATLAEGPQHGEEVGLLVDVGTNAEIVLGHRDRVLAASSPTGPAFEGAEISCGQRAAPGAIERVRIDPETLEPRIRVIGTDAWSNEPGFAEGVETTGVTGVCGSGIIEALAELFLAGVITEDGVIDGTKADRSRRIVPDGRTFAYRLWDGDNALRITQNDVRAIQLAKAALYAGIRLLMDRLNIDRIDRIKLAGAFGSYIEPRYAMVIGLIPDCGLDAVSSVGNAAGTGARMALVNRGHRREIEALVERIEKIETAMEPRFQEHFVAAMAFPNKRDAFPRLAAAVTMPERTAGDEAGLTPRRRSGRRRRV